MKTDKTNHPQTTFKLPAFLAGLFAQKPRTQPQANRHWWDNYPDTASVRYENNTKQYQPKYQ